MKYLKTISVICLVNTIISYLVFNKFIPYRESRVIELIVDTFDFAFAFIVLLTIKNI